MIYVRKSAGATVFLICLFLLSAFALLTFRGEQIDLTAAAIGGAATLIVLIYYNTLTHIYRHIDRFALVIPLFLCCMGLVMQYRLSPDGGKKQLILMLIGLVALVAAIEVVRRQRGFGRWNYLFMGLTVAALAVAFLFAEVQGGAKNWLEVAGVSVQPSELAKVTYIIVTAWFFSTKSRVRDLWLYIIFTAACVVLLVLSRDLGAALLYALTFIIMFYAGTGRTLLTLGAVGVLGAGAAASYKLFSHVRTRVEVWRDPWASHQSGGYQIVQGLMAIASGGFLGTGLTLGYPVVIPAVKTDYVFAAVCEEFGIVVGIVLILFYLLFIVRGALIAMDASEPFDKLLVFGATAMLSLQCFIIIGGVIKLIPLTGITLPFISAGGSSMLTSMILVGVMEGVAIKSGAKGERELQDIGGDVL